MATKLMIQGEQVQGTVSEAENVYYTNSDGTKESLQSEVDSINTNLDILLNKDFSFTTIAPGGRTQNISGGYYKLGKLVIAQFTFEAKVQLTANDYWTLFNLPTPVNGGASLSSAIDAGTGTTNVYVNSSGSCCITTNVAIPVGKKVYVSGMYYTT